MERNQNLMNIRNNRLLEIFNGKFLINPKKENKMGRIIFEYIKRNKKVVGLFIGWKAGKDKVGLGYSLCNKQDKFSWNTAVDLCFNRMFLGTAYYDNMPSSIRRQEAKFMDRCEKYFKARCCALSDSFKDKSIFEKHLPEHIISKINKETKPRNKALNITRHSESVMFFREASIQIGHDGVDSINFGGRVSERPESGYIEVSYKIFK